MSFEFDAEEDRRRSAAGILKLRVGLALVDDARRRGAFETDEEKLTERVGEILSSLGAAGWNPNAVSIDATPLDADCLTLSTPTGRGGSDGTTLRSDGVVLSQFTSMGVSVATIEEVDELSPEEREEIAAAQAAWQERMQWETFQGRRFLRALPLDPQPGAEVQVLAVELFDDGFVVHHTFERTQEEFEREIDEDPLDETEASRNRLRVEDDLGTRYRRGGGGGGGTGVVRSSWEFAPAVPENARALRISTVSGSAELPL